MDILVAVLSVTTALGLTALALYLRLRRKYYEWKRWQCPLNGGYREYYQAIHEVEAGPDGYPLLIRAAEVDRWEQEWWGEWIECSLHCSEARSGVCVQNVIVKVGPVEALRRLRAYHWREGEPRQDLLRGRFESTMAYMPHPITGDEIAPVAKWTVWMEHDDRSRRSQHMADRTGDATLDIVSSNDVGDDLPTDYP